VIKDLMGVAGRTIAPFKRKAYGNTFICPVCHLELSFDDTNADGLLVCPVCGAVIHLEAPYGHPVPVVLDMEIRRAQPKLRLHPLASHFPVGLFPLALLGALALLVLSLLGTGSAVALERATLVVLAVSVALSPLAIAAGLWDWWRRYGRRPYRIITLKIAFSVAFVVLGGAAVALHASGAVFSPATGLLNAFSPLHLLAAAAYFALLALDMIIVATLGHVGGNLVFGA
jgi:uncharacterized protein YbaR (Trm112 family)